MIVDGVLVNLVGDVPDDLELGERIRVTGVYQGKNKLLVRVVERVETP
jgi:hypothetical protein